MYPVGSLYYNKTDVTTMINSTFPGKWERVKDVFILAVGDTYKANTSGGEATHKLTIDEMPSHGHSIEPYGGRAGYGQAGHTGTISQLAETVFTAYSASNTGGDQPHNNMPPYKTYYCWERVS